MRDVVDALIFEMRFFELAKGLAKISLQLNCSWDH